MKPGQSRAGLSPVKALALAAALGLSTGAATSLLQAVLPSPWSALVNAASPWLAVAFVAGAYASTPGIAAIAGAVTCAGEVVGYYVTAAARGLPSNFSTILFWIGCGLIGGPVLAVAGQVWRRGSTLTRLAAAGVLATCFFLEALRYAVVLHYGSSAALFAVMGVAVMSLGALLRPAPQGSVTQLVAPEGVPQP